MARDYNFWIYIVTNRNHSVLYIEVTNRLSRLSSSGELDLTRHRYDPAARGRSAEPIHATRELLGKLFNDLAATAPSGS